MTHLHAAPASSPHAPDTAPNAFSLLLPELRRALAEEAYAAPTPIQERSIPPLLDGRDILGSARTGTGKTAAFVLPILQRLVVGQKNAISGKPKVLILAPTRELASQIDESIATYGRHTRISAAAIFGGVKQRSQVDRLKKGCHIVTATPGRLLDLFNQGFISFEAIEIFVLDEADRMLDMGFLPDIRRIIEKLPAKRQSLFFSATLAPEVVALAKKLVHNPVEVAISPDVPVVEQIAQSVLFVDRDKKTDLLVNILKDAKLDKVLVFARLKYGANRIADKLNRAGVSAAAIHGDKAQNARIRTLDDFKRGTVRVLVATDIAARGIDIDRISHVVNYDLPNEPQTYVHRIGRTARAGAQGDAISFCSAEERDALRVIEKFIRRSIPVRTDHPFHSTAARAATGADARPKPREQQVRQQRIKSEVRLQKEISYSPGRTGQRQDSFRGRR